MNKPLKPESETIDPFLFERVPIGRDRAQPEILADSCGCNCNPSACGCNSYCFCNAGGCNCQMVLV
jgi:hypothetical protein